MLTLTNAVLLVLAFLITWSIAKAIRNIYWHELSAFPGPHFYAASRVPYALRAITGKLAVKLHDLHEEYGPIVRTAPNELSFIECSAWKTIHGQQGQSRPYRKNYDFDIAQRNIGHTIFITGDEDHARMRGVLKYAFSPESLRHQEVKIKKHTQELIDGLEQERQASDIVNLQNWFSWIAFDNIADSVFHEPFNCLVDPAYRPWLELLSKLWRVITYVVMLKDFLPSELLIGWTIPIPVMQRKVEDFNIVGKRVRQRMARNASDSDFMSSVIKHNDEKGDLTEEEVISNISLLVFAGTETVATLLPALIYLLSQNRQPLQKLTNEIRTTFAEEDTITIQDLSNIEYLTACIKEALRLFPPIPEGLPRVVPPEGDLVCGRWVPGGTRIQVSTLAANMSQRNFARPKSFIPERWLASDPYYGLDILDASQPFSTGPRNCIGQAFAMAEVRYIVARLLWRYDIRCVTQSEWTDQPAYILWERKPLLMELKHRID